MEVRISSMRIDDRLADYLVLGPVPGNDLPFEYHPLGGGGKQDRPAEPTGRWRENAQRYAITIMRITALRYDAEGNSCGFNAFGVNEHARHRRQPLGPSSLTYFLCSLPCVLRHFCACAEHDLTFHFDDTKRFWWKGSTTKWHGFGLSPLGHD